MTGSKNLRYFGYALGELVLVVLGILIALQINNWNEGRLERIQEREYMVSMLNDLRTDLDQIEPAVTGNAILLDGLNRLLGLISERRDDPEYFRELFMHSIVYTYWYLRADFSDPTLSQLMSSGGLLLIEDSEVRAAMLGYEKGLAEYRHRDRELTNYFHVMEESQKLLMNFSLAKGAFEHIEDDFLRILDPLETFDPLIADGQYLLDDGPALTVQYYGDVLFYRTTLNNLVAALQKQKSLATDLTHLIKQNYGIE